MNKKKILFITLALAVGFIVGALAVTLYYGYQNIRL